MAVALAEMAMAGGIGAEVEKHPDYTEAQWWFGEDQGRYIVTVPDTDALKRSLAKGTRERGHRAGGFRRLGTVGGDALFGISVDDLKEAHESFFRNWMAT